MPNLQCEIIRVGGRRCLLSADFAVSVSDAHRKTRICCSNHALEIVTDDPTAVLIPIADFPIHTNIKMTYRCTHCSTSEYSSRCTETATFQLIHPDGSENPGGRFCTVHAFDCIEEYATKLGEQWSLEAL